MDSLAQRTRRRLADDDDDDNMAYLVVMYETLREREDYMREQREKFKPKFVRFELLDKVFTEFLQTNTFRGRHSTLDDIITDCMNSSRERFYLFTHANLPYHAAIRVREKEDYDEVQIQLPNDGFQYYYKSGSKAYHHQWRSGVELEIEHCLQYMPQMLALLRPKYDKTEIFCHYAEKRLDVRFHPKNSHAPALLVSYTEGYPETRSIGAQEI